MLWTTAEAEGEVRRLRFLLFYVSVLDFSAACTLCTFSHIYLSSGNWVAACCEIAAHPGYDMFTLLKYPIVNLVFPTSVFIVGISSWFHHFLIIAYFYLSITIMAIRKVKI